MQKSRKNVSLRESLPASYNFLLFSLVTRYGNGVYFARDAAYSTRTTYSPADGRGNRILYLTRVLVGEYTTGRQGMVTPPPKASGVSTDIYDTVVNNTSNPSIFVVFYDNQCYPDYMITFKGTMTEGERMKIKQAAQLSSKKDELESTTGTLYTDDRQPLYNEGEWTDRSEREMEEGSQSRPRYSDRIPQRELKYPPRHFSSELTTDSTKRAGDFHNTQYSPHNSWRSAEEQHPYCDNSASYRSFLDSPMANSGATTDVVDHRDSQLGELCDEEEVESMDTHNIAVSKEAGSPLSSRKGELYVKLPEKTPAFMASGTVEGIYHNVPVAPILSPGIPPPTYSEAYHSNGLSEDDYVMIEGPHYMEGGQVETKHMRTAGLSERSEIKGMRFPENYYYLSSQSKEIPESDISSINTSMTHRLTLGTDPGSVTRVPNSSTRSQAVYRNSSTPMTKRGSEGKLSETEKLLTDLQATPERRHYSTRSRVISGEVQTPIASSSRKPCDVCSLEVPEFICKDCYKMLCEKCQTIFNTDECEKTQAQHDFLNFGWDKKSGEKSSERGVLGSSAESTENWDCARCTFVNPAEQSVCSMCATTRGVSKIELPGHCDFYSLAVPDFASNGNEKGQNISNTDLCEKAKSEHDYFSLRDEKKGRKKTSHRERKKSKKRGTLGSSAKSTENWNCARCTFVNPAEHSVCSMCAKTRGVSIKLVPEPASRVCRACTFHNKDGSHVCEMCGKTLRLDTAESTV